MLQKALQPLSSLHEKICGRLIVKDYDKTLTALKRIMEAIHEGANLPCKELFLAYEALIYFYYLTGDISSIITCQPEELNDHICSSTHKRRKRQKI